MTFFIDFIRQVFWLVKEASVFMLLGLLIAGFLRYLISDKAFASAFGKDDFRSTFLASLLGIPLPLCSCSVLPMMISLKERGASKGATTAFLISTPETGVDSIGVTYALLDPIFTIARPVAALLSALVTGSVVNLFVRRGWDEPGPRQGGQAPECCGPPGEESESGTGGACGRGGASCEGAEPPPAEARTSLLRRAAAYGFGSLMDSLTPLLVLAFLSSGIIAVIVPEGFFQNPVTQGWSGMFLMLLVGIPLYVCATSSTPIVAVLLLKGLSPGAALVFLLAGPVTNIGTILAVWRYLGKRIMMVYLGCMAVLTLFMGAMVESIYRDLGTPVKAIVGTSSGLVPEPLKVAGAVVLLGLLAVSAARIRLLSRWGEALRRAGRPLGIDPLGRPAKAVYAAVPLLLYLSTCFSTVDTGEVGWILTFGRVERDAAGRVVTRERPGLYVHYPYPFQTMAVCRPGAVRAVQFGFRPPRERADGGAFSAFNLSTDAELEAEAQVMDGEENLVSIKFSVFYRVKDPFLYTFGVEDPEGLVKGYAADAVRCVCARLATQDVLVGHRDELEQAGRERLQADLDRIGAGIEVLRVAFVDVHAPPEVHYAFRDVASAAEDKYKEDLKGESVYLETLALARGQAYRIEQESESLRHARVNSAQGKAKAFRARAAAYRETRELTRLRLYFETFARVFSAVRAVYPLAPGIDVELWYGGAGGVPFLPSGAGKAPEGAAHDNGGVAPEREKGGGPNADVRARIDRILRGGG